MEQLKSLVGRAQSGDLDAYGEVVRRFQDMAYGYAYSLLGDFHLAEDAAQDAFLEAYRCLANLREPAAFPGWFRRIVFKHCDRLTRGKALGTVPLEAAGDLPGPLPPPDQAAQDRELKDRVLAAIVSLDEHERTVTTLFYINGYTQSDIAEFLEVPPGTVKSRLHSSRQRLRERMIGMVKETLHHNAPDERFSQIVIERLLARPNLLHVEGHPVKQVWERMQAALPGYEIVTGPEVEGPEVFAAAQDHAWDLAYRLNDKKALRYQMTTVTMSAIRGRTPPVHLLAAGRVFRPDKEDATHSKAFHQMDGICIESGANANAYKATCQRLLESALPDARIVWKEHDYGGFVNPGFCAS